MKPSLLMFNEDNTHQFYEYWSAHLDRLTPEIAEEYIAQYVGSQVTDYLINVNSLNSSFPSEYFTSYADKYLQKRENGHDVDYTDTHARYFYQSFVEDNYDMYAHWIVLLRKIGIRPWLSFRMNDCHDNFAEASMMLCDFYHEHPELRRVAHHPWTGYYDNCFDFAKEPIRARFLGYIDEALERYDVDGIELDFMREPFCFSIGGEYEGRHIMTQFVSDVKAITEKYGALRGKKLQISVRVPRSPEDCLYMGLDVLAWVQAKMVDVVVASPRYSPTDNDIPVEFWKQILSPYKVRFACAVELITRCCLENYAPTLNTHETALASCCQYLSAGADFAYLFNYMHSNVTNYDNPDDEIMSSELYKWDNYQKLIRNAGKEETALTCTRRYLPTFQDLAPMWKNGQTTRLPAVCREPRHYTPVRVRTGKLPLTDRVLLILGCEADDKTPLSGKDFEIYVNSTPITRFVGTETIRPAWTQKTGYIFELDPSVMTQVNMFELCLAENGKPFVCDFLEVRAIPQA